MVSMNEGTVLFILFYFILFYLITLFFDLFIKTNQNQARKIYANEAQQFVTFNKRQISRVFPAGYRVDSSNFNPQEMW